MSEYALSLAGVHKRFKSNHVLCGIDLSQPVGSIVGLMGKNGAGKSTMIKCLLGLLKTDAGTASVFDDNSWDLTAGSKQRIGYVPQTMTGFAWMKVETMLEYTGAFYNVWNKEKVKSLLLDWDLNPQARISHLSEGEKQKLSIIQSLGHEPDLFIFDEPVAALDPSARRQFLRELIDLNMDENRSMLFSTHISTDLERVAAEHVFLDNIPYSNGFSIAQKHNTGALSSCSRAVERVFYAGCLSKPSSEIRSIRDHPGRINYYCPCGFSLDILDTLSPALRHGYCLWIYTDCRNTVGR